MFDRLRAILEGRSPRWPAVRRAWLRGHPACEVCGGVGGNDVHHVEPFHVCPARELDPANLMTLCRPHHLLVGHLMRWADWNPTAREDAAAWLAKIKARTAVKLMPDIQPDPIPPDVPAELTPGQFGRRLLSLVFTQLSRWAGPLLMALVAYLTVQGHKDLGRKADAVAEQVTAAHAETAAKLEQQDRELKRALARPPVVKWGE